MAYVWIHVHHIVSRSLYLLAISVVNRQDILPMHFLHFEVLCKYISPIVTFLIFCVILKGANIHFFTQVYKMYGAAYRTILPLPC